ncbi:basic salivary proline-rich protein 2-like [Oxyura jamaicensis]|uniref:basic salivary proline-rich protein 2-like n=1 Tax=Oxyura jamaicensis TaxID=8884 RepID=UPI0015A5DEEC|nr:basic salivary proline-rich protein 2-like [Oxyura jamaicensis]
MDDDRPLFSTFRPEDNAASAQPGHGATPLQPPRAEQPPEHPDAQGRAPPGWPPPGGGRAAGAGGPVGAHQAVVRADAGQEAGGRGRAPSLVPRLHQPEGDGAAAAGPAAGLLLGALQREHRGLRPVLQGQGALPPLRAGPAARRALRDPGRAQRPRRAGRTAAALRRRARHALPRVPDGAVPTAGQAPWGGCSPPAAAPHHQPPRRRTAPWPSGRREPGRRRGTAPREAPGRLPAAPPPLPAKVGSSSAPQGPRSRAGSGGAAPEGPYAQAQCEAVPAEPPEAKYQQLVRFHTYAEPRECAEPEEPIPFYAMGRGRGPPPPEENVYSEVALAQRSLPPLLPRGPRGPVSTLPPKARAPTEPARRRLFRSFSSQASRRRQPPAAPTAGGGQRGAPSPPLEAPRDPSLEFDDPVYGPRKSSAPRAPTGQEENIYEQLSGGRP